MTNSLFSRFTVVGCLVAVMALSARISSAVTLISPTPDQIVRENVRITIPMSAVPPDMVASAGQKVPDEKRPYVSLQVKDESKKIFVVALSGDCGKVRNNRITFVWNSKAPYRDPADPKEEKFFKDGQYTLLLSIHGSDGSVTDSGSVKIQLRNKVARSNPAPAVRLVNRLPFGRSHTYGVHAGVGVYETISGFDLPILGGLGMSSDFKVIQTVEDIRDDGSLLLRYRIARGAQVNSFGHKRLLYENDEFGAQLYRLVTKFGSVLDANVFSRQAQYTITDILPILPTKPVKEGDSWPSTMTLKVEGITDPIKLTGTSMLDSFEWQDGHECAKIVSRMSGNGRIAISGGKVRSESAIVKVPQMTTFLAYRSGLLIRNEIMLEFPVIILPGAGEPGSEKGDIQVASMDETDAETDEVFQRGSPGGAAHAANRGGKKPNGLPEGAKKGNVKINVVFRLEK